MAERRWDAQEQRFARSEMRNYWERHADLRGAFELEQDPDGLANVCHPGRPIWLNRYYAKHQRRVYWDLLSSVPAAAPGARALDVGCGAGRWSRLLADGGYATTGIDLQAELIEANRRRYPDVEFVQAAAQEFRSPQPFDLVSTVTVIQHIPFAEQRAVIDHLRTLVKTGGRFIALENVSHQELHVFARRIDDWTALFGEAGFELLESRPYDYSPSLRALERLTKWLKAQRAGDAPVSVETHHTAAGAIELPRGVRSVQMAAMRAGTLIDSAIEPACIRLAPPLSSVHCGFLFRAA